MKVSIEIPTPWLAEAVQAYCDYVTLWEAEEEGRTAGSGGEPEPVQAWPLFLSEYASAELEAAVG